MRPRLLYLMHVPWGWIKQRPHFIAEGLTDSYEVNVFYRKALTVNKKNLKEKFNKNLNIKEFVTIPFEKIPLVKNIKLDFLNKLILRYYIRRISQYKFIWITSPILYNYIEPYIQDNQIVIFDCMDDELEFPAVKQNPKLALKIASAEKKILNRANVIFFSATYLLEKVCIRNNDSECIKSKSYVVNNAISLPEPNLKRDSRHLHVLEELKSDGFVLMTYIGAISEWFDFDLVINALKINPKLKLVLVGPAHVSIPNNNQIISLGSVPREDIFSIMELSDGLIMPFKVSELIKSVNPVKLYEYIFANKPILAPKYSESEVFENNVYLYRGTEEFFTLCSKLEKDHLRPKASPSENLEFVNRNTWENRLDIIKGVLQNISEYKL